MSSCQEVSKEAQEIIEQRTAQVRQEANDLFRRVALIFAINDEGLLAGVDALCQIDRQQIFLEEAKKIIQEMENSNGDFISENRGILSSIPRDEEGSGV